MGQALYKEIHIKHLIKKQQHPKTFWPGRCHSYLGELNFHNLGVWSTPFSQAKAKQFLLYTAHSVLNLSSVFLFKIKVQVERPLFWLYNILLCLAQTKKRKAEIVTSSQSGIVSFSALWGKSYTARRKHFSLQLFMKPGRWRVKLHKQVPCALLQGWQKMTSHCWDFEKLRAIWLVQACFNFLQSLLVLLKPLLPTGVVLWIAGKRKALIVCFCHCNQRFGSGIIRISGFACSHSNSLNPY